MVIRPHRIVAAAALQASLFLCALLVAPAKAATPEPIAIPTAPPPPALPAVPTVAPGYAAPEVTPPPAQIAGVTMRPFVGIALQDAVALALAKDPQLAVSEENRRIAGYRVVAAKGAYDVRFQIVPSDAHIEQPPTNPFFAGPNFGALIQNKEGISAGFTGLLKGGQQYAISISASKENDNTIVDSFNPYYPSNISVSFVQPILRGVDAAKHALTVAEIGSDAARASLDAQAQQTVADVENAYWDLVAAWRNVAIQEEALKQAIAQQNSTIRLARKGAAAPVDAVESSAQVDLFRQNVYAALQNVALLQNKLKALVVTDPKDPIWEANLVPTSPVLQMPHVPALADLVTAALRRRPEIREVIDARRSAAADLAFARSQVKPRLDLDLSYQSNGFAGTAIPPSQNAFLATSIAQTTAIDQLIAAVNATLPPGRQIPPLPVQNQSPPPYLVGGLNQSLTNLLQNKFPTYAAQLTLDIPIGNRTARGEYAIAEQAEKIAEIQEAATIDRIVIEARTAIQAYQTALARLEAARAQVRAADTVYRSEVRKFRNGDSTTFLVLQRQVQLAEARGLELQAQTDLDKAIVEIERTEGTILQDSGVQRLP